MISKKLEHALSSHRKWKSRLRDEFARGSCELDAAIVSLDDQCELGRWLLSVREAEDFQGPRLIEIMRLHSDFHREAGRVVRLIQKGDLNQAEEELGRGDYAVTTLQLTAKIVLWLEELETSPQVPLYKAAEDFSAIETT